MVDLSEKAERADEDVYGIEDAADYAGRFRVESLELVDPDGLGTDAYPIYGDWMPVTAMRDGLEVGEAHVEIPRGLAEKLVEVDIEVGDTFAVEDAVKNMNGEWEVEVDAVHHD